MQQHAERDFADKARRADDENPPSLENLSW
jgi:hypothetical protein